MLYPFLVWIRDRAQKLDFSSKEIREIELACEEAFVNVIYHAYGDLGGEVEVEVQGREQEIEVTIKDQGKPFDPLSKKEQAEKLSASLEERDVGGLGILFMCRYMDDIRYRREEPYNVLTLCKKIAVTA